MQRSELSPSVAYAPFAAGEPVSLVEGIVARDTAEMLNGGNLDGARQAHASATERLDSQIREIKADIARVALQDPRVKVAACARGCAHCCHGRISVLPIEAIRIAQRIEALPPERGERFRSRIQSYIEKTAGLSPYAKAALRAPCPFLEDDGACGVYEARPVMCRMHHSTDAGRCAESMRDPLVPIPTIPAFPDVAMPVLSGLHRGTREAGLCSQNLTLAEAVDLALKPGTVSNWLRGEDAFASAKDDDPDLISIREGGLRQVQEAL